MTFNPTRRSIMAAGAALLAAPIPSRAALAQTPIQLRFSAVFSDQDIRAGITTPADMAGIKLRMPGGDAWQFLGTALGANPQPVADAAIAQSTEAHLAREAELAASFAERGLQVYAPDVEAFRKHAQDMYLASDLAKDWPAGMLEKIAAL